MGRVIMSWTELSPSQRDALVAEKLFGCKVIQISDNFGQPVNGCGCEGEPHEYPADHTVSGPLLSSYSQSIQCAWLVVEEMQKREYIVSLHGSDGKYGALVGPCMCHPDRKIGYTDTMMPTAPEAICLAALRALGVEIE